MWQDEYRLKDVLMALTGILLIVVLLWDKSNIASK
jgi:hypothetical protein